MNTRSVFAFAGFLLFLILAAFPSVTSANHSWNKYHWARTSNPFTIKLGNNTSGTWTGHLSTASTDWSVSSVLDTMVVPGGTSASTCSPTSGRVEVCNADYGNTGWLGVAQIWLTIGSHIAQGTVKNNDYYFGTSTYQYNNQAEQLHVMCQEIGHTFGLGHQDESGASLNTCMDYYHNTSDSDTLSTHPNQHDYDQLVSIYKHKDRFNSYGSASAKLPAQLMTGNLNHPSQWGRLVQTIGNGRASVFEKDLGADHKVVTLVIWAQ